MATLWEMLTNKKPEKITQEDLFYNPLGMKIGNHVKINTLEFEDLSFNLTKIRVVDRNIDGEIHKFVDYDLMAKPLFGDNVKIRLRLIPKEEPVGEIDTTHSVLLLRCFSEFPYDKPFHEGLDYEENKGEFLEYDLPCSTYDIDEKGKPLYEGAMFYRVNDMQPHWEALTSVLEDKNSDGFVEESEVKKYGLHYWDFWRKNKEDGVPIIEFYIVEMDANYEQIEGSGYFTVWYGKEIDPSRVDVL